MNEIQYSVVVPVYNSSPTLDELYSRVKKTFEELGPSYEIIFVNDGSTDDSWDKLKEIKDSDPDRVTAVRLSKNFGQHNATFCGFNFARGKFILTLDDDLQTPPEEMVKLVSSQEEGGFDLVYGIYQKKKHSRTRNLGSKLLKRSASWYGRPGEGSSFRLIDREVIEKLLVHHQNFVFIDELLLWYTDNINFLPVKHEKRKGTRTGYTFLKLWGMFSNLLIYYTTIPLKIMIYGGLLSSLVFFIMAVIFIINKLVFDVPLGWSSLIVAICFTTSLILFCLGIIGEYLSRIYMVQNKKPPYSIARVL